MESVLGLVRHPGNDALFRAVEMSLLATLAGQTLHIHAEGLRGTGKTTIMRAVRRLLPRIRRIKGCLYNCDPIAPHCPVHRGMGAAQVTALGDEWVPMPFLEISHSAKIGTVVGSIDLARLVSPTEPEAALLPGTIPQAHRGIIFIDEINRLAETSPELADVLLDVMGTKPGRVQIEETGLPPVELGIQVSVWAASNPDEDPGPLEEIRRQLSDRFDFAIYADRPGDPESVERILAMAERATPSRPSPMIETQAEIWRTRLTLRAAELRKVETPQAIRQQVAGLYSRFDLESLRAVQAIQSGIRLTACLQSRAAVSQEDLNQVVPMALRHRVEPETVRKILASLAAGPERVEQPVLSAKGRFPGLSFGGVVAERAESPAQSPEPDPSPTAHAAPPLAGAQEQRVRQAVDPDGESWLRRTLSQLGLNRPGEQAGEPGGAKPGLDRLTGRSASQAVTRGEWGAGVGGAPGQPGPVERRQGLGFGHPPAQSSAHPTAHPSSHPTAHPSVGPAMQAGTQPPGARSGEAQRLARSGGAAHLPDPAEYPPDAPPNRARPLSALRPEDWVRTEEELGRS